MSKLSTLANDTYVDLVLPNLKANSRKKAIQELSDEVSAHIQYPAHKIFHLLMDKEYHDSSAIGQGVAVPQLKLQQMNKPFCALAVLDKPVNFGAADGRSVDIICAVFSPEHHGPLHLRRLARMSRLLKNEDLCEKIRDARDEDVIRSLLISPEGWMLAA